MNHETARKRGFQTMIRKVAAVALTAAFIFGITGILSAETDLPLVSVIWADDATSSSYSSPVYDFYIRVQSPDGSGIILRKQPNTNSPALLNEAIPDGTVLHITGQADDGNGGLWGFTNYSDVAEGYVLLQQTVTVEKDSLLNKDTDVNAAAEASVKRREQELQQYFQTVDENGNPVDENPFGTGSSSSSSSSSSASSESVTASSGESVAADSGSESVKMTSGSEAVSAMSGSEAVSSSSGSLNSNMISVGPLQIPKMILFVAVGAVAAVAVVIVILKKKKNKAGGDEGGDAGNAAGAGKGGAAKKGLKKGLKMPKSKPVKQSAADKMKKK